MLVWRIWAGVVLVLPGANCCCLLPVLGLFLGLLLGLFLVPVLVLLLVLLLGPHVSNFSLGVLGLPPGTTPGPPPVLLTYAPTYTYIYT